MNYNSVDKILSADITNMEVIINNRKTLDNFSMLGVDWFKFNGNVASNIYVDGEYSWIGFGSDSQHLEVNNRQGPMYYLYREEGTLYGYYKFLRIRRIGYSHSYLTDPSYFISYDVILWDTGDISLHMNSIPTLYNNGTYSLNASSTYTYTVSASAPDVTFIKTDSGFTVVNDIISLAKPYDDRFLIRSGSTYYTVKDGTLSLVEISELSSATFLEYGVEAIPSPSLLMNLTNPELLYWISNNTVTANGLTVYGIPPVPQILYYNIQIIPTNSEIQKIEAFDFDNSLLTVTFDEGATWKYYNNGWITATAETEGMEANILKNITQEQWAEIATSSSYQFRCVLLSITSIAGSIGVKYN